MRFSTRHVLYDGGCGLCSRTSKILRRLDWFKRTVRHDIAHDWPAIEQQFKQVDVDACMRDMHVITEDGRVYRGFDSYRSLAWVLPLAWPILPLLYLPPVKWVGGKIYRRVADSRRACQVPAS